MFDPYFRVEVLNRLDNAEQLVYAAMHQDYCEDFVSEDLEWVSQYTVEKGYYPGKINTFKDSGELVVKYLFQGNRGHYGPAEHPQIVFNIGWFPHSTMQQIRTHRVGMSMDVQSGRYTGKRILAVADGTRQVEEVFYLRPVGDYTDRQGKKYHYSQSQREDDIAFVQMAVVRYAKRIQEGLSEEHARGIIPFDIRQHFVMSCNLRSLMHLLLIRGKKDAQLECQILCEMLMPHFKLWTPSVYEWFEKNLWLKGRLAP
jgi:thymidylate synthase (FAD)